MTTAGHRSQPAFGAAPAESSALILAAAQAWLAEDPDPATAAALSETLAAARSGDQTAAAELVDAFSATLQFGTAGLRGALGPGPNRMNRVVVAGAAAGLAQYLRDTGHGGEAVVVGFDARHGSARFATDTAEIMSGAGLRAVVCPRPLPTPVLAGAVLHHRAAAGVMVTASHNPPQDNGYKVYLGDGSQVVPPADAEIAARIAAVGPLAGIPRSDDYQVLGEEVVAAYLDRVASLALPGGPREVRVAYTALHGVGSPLLRAALARAGFAAPLAVAEQDDPDPDFPTVAFPNPEEPGAMDLALALAGSAGVDVVLANDPDADRCAVGIPMSAGRYRMLTGDEVLDDLSRAHGVHAPSQVSARVEDPARIPELMAGLRADPPLAFGGFLVASELDLSAGTADLPPTDGLRYLLAGGAGVAGARVIVRPSGTEPKVKAYLEVRADVADGDLAAARTAAGEAMAAIAGDVRTRLGG